MIRTNNNQHELKKAVEEQLDLILKIEEDRKLLKRQNKTLNQKYLKLTQTLKKYTNTQKNDQSTLTDIQQKPTTLSQATYTQIETQQRGCQVDLIDQKQQQNINHMNNTSRLTEAMSFLKAIDTSQLQQSSRVIAQQSFGTTSNILQNESLKKISQKLQKQQQNSQISSEIIKMSKQMAALKRELKESQAKGKLRQKEMKELKKCLQTKSEALQKSRRQFNELSQLLNTDKYKSVRSLQAENQKLRVKAEKIDQQALMIQSLKEMLQNVTNEFSIYRGQKQRKIASLIKELKSKDQAVEQLEEQLSQFKTI